MICEIPIGHHPGTCMLHSLVIFKAQNLDIVAHQLMSHGCHTEMRRNQNNPGLKIHLYIPPMAAWRAGAPKIRGRADMTAAVTPTWCPSQVRPHSASHARNVHSPVWGLTYFCEGAKKDPEGDFIGDLHIVIVQCKDSDLLTWC